MIDHSVGVNRDVNDFVINIHFASRKPSELSQATLNYPAARYLLDSPPGHRCSVAAMFVLLLALLVVQSPRSAVGDPAGSAHVDGAPPSKIGEESGLIKRRIHPRNLARVSSYAEDRKLG